MRSETHLTHVPLVLLRRLQPSASEKYPISFFSSFLSTSLITSTFLSLCSLIMHRLWTRVNSGCKVKLFLVYVCESCRTIAFSVRSTFLHFTKPHKELMLLDVRFYLPFTKKREQSWRFMNHMTVAFSLASLSASSSKLVLCKKKNVKEEKFTLVPRMKFFFLSYDDKAKIINGSIGFSEHTRQLDIY